MKPPFVADRAQEHKICPQGIKFFPCVAPRTPLVCWTYSNLRLKFLLSQTGVKPTVQTDGSVAVQYI